MTDQKKGTSRTNSEADRENLLRETAERYDKSGELNPVDFDKVMDTVLESNRKHMASVINSILPLPQYHCVSHKEAQALFIHTLEYRKADVLLSAVPYGKYLCTICVDNNLTRSRGILEKSIINWDECYKSIPDSDNIAVISSILRDDDSISLIPLRNIIMSNRWDDKLIKAIGFEEIFKSIFSLNRWDNTNTQQ